MMLYRITLLFTCLVLFFFACKSDDDTNTPELPEVGFPDGDLIGNWNGTFSGDFGTAPLSCSLTIEGTLTCTIPTGSPYCKINGQWGVINDIFFTSGEDDCEESEVRFAAPKSLTTLTGTWITPDGEEGTFEMDKL